MTAIVMNLKGKELSDPMEELLLDERFTEAELESAVEGQLRACGVVATGQDLMVVGRQASMKIGSKPGKGLTLDVIALSSEGRLWVFEIKVSRDNFASMQALQYVAIADSFLAEDVVALYCRYLKVYQNEVVAPSEAKSRLAVFCGGTTESELELAEETPGIVVVSPVLTGEELAGLELLTKHGFEAYFLQVRLLKSGAQEQLLLQRLYPAVDPQFDGLPGTQRRRSVKAENEHQGVQPEKRRGRPAKPEELKFDEAAKRIIDHLCTGVGNEGISTSDLRTATGAPDYFTPVMEYLEQRDLILRSVQPNGRRGPDPLFVFITDEGRAAHQGLLPPVEGDRNVPSFSAGLLPEECDLQDLELPATVPLPTSPQAEIGF
jgi:hypothetical protein